MSSTPAENHALILIKPHATKNVNVMHEFVLEHLRKHQIRVIQSAILKAEQIETREIIDQHYLSIARFAMLTDPIDIPMTKESENIFKKEFSRNNNNDNSNS